MEFVFGCWQLRSTDMLAEEVFRRDWQLSHSRHQIGRSEFSRMVEETSGDLKLAASDIAALFDVLDKDGTGLVRAG